MRKKLKNLTAITLALALGLAVVGCGSSAAGAPASAAPQAPGAPAMPAPAAAPRAQRAMPAAAPTSAPAASSAPAPALPAPAAAQPAAAPITQALQAATAAPAQAAPAPAAPAASAPAPQMQLHSIQSTGGQVAQSQSGVGPRGGQPGATTFEDYERTPFVYTSEDSVSTFSLDTDRTSYHLALNWARSGYDVEPDSVRSEEWINAFNYNYAQPSRDDSFAVHTDLIPHPLDDYKVLARIGFQAPELRDDGRPLNVTLVLDASGSMADGDRVDIAREAAESIRKSLSGDDRIAVVHFTEDVIHRLTVEHEKRTAGMSEGLSTGWSRTARRMCRRVWTLASD